MTKEKILLEHGAGGLLSNELVRNLFLPAFHNPFLQQLTDSAVLELGDKKICFTTDSYVVSPIFFPGGDIGSLAVHGTVNDLAVCGGKPLCMSAGFILEEGFPVGDLAKIIESMAVAARKAGVQIVTGDTKVVPKGAADGMFINTSGIGLVEYPHRIAPGSIAPGDVIIVNGSIGDHGAAIMGSREDLQLDAGIVSDSAPLNGLIAEILESGSRVHCMRDATRGGLGAVLVELAGQSGAELEVRESDIPVKESVRGLCEILGIDPLFLANEGKLALFCPGPDAPEVLEIMRKHELGRDAAVIGKAGAATPGKSGRALLRTVAGGMRVMDLPSGELVPRIC
ncbi:MAG: hydrogenase expression/formation protein HypE [Syntrophaceae bacterium]